MRVGSSSRDAALIAAAVAAGRVTVSGGAAPAGAAFVEVPIPPSTNHLFLTAGKRRVATRAYREWRANTEPLVRGLAPPAAYPVGVRYTLTGKVFAQRDLGNIEKPLTDLLVSAGVLKDDRLAFVGRIVLAHEPGLGEPRVRIELEKA